MQRSPRAEQCKKKFKGRGVEAKWKYSKLHSSSTTMITCWWWWWWWGWQWWWWSMMGSLNVTLLQQAEPSSWSFLIVTNSMNWWIEFIIFTIVFIIAITTKAVINIANIATAKPSLLSPMLRCHHDNQQQSRLQYQKLQKLSPLMWSRSTWPKSTAEEIILTLKDNRHSQRISFSNLFL